MTKRIKGLISTLATVTVLTLLGIGGSRYIKNLSPRKTISEEGVKIYVEGLSFYSGSDKIVGTVYKPQDTTGRKAAVIWCNDLGSDSRSADQICRAIATKGYIAYTFDFRGGSPQSKSTGDPLSMSVATEKKDLETVISRLRKESFVSDGKIYLGGFGQGALVASMAAGSKGVKGLILVAPAFNLPDMAELQYPKNRQIKDSTDFAGTMVVGKSFITEAKNVKPYRGLSKFGGDVLIIHGSDDQTVPLEYSRRAAEELSSCDLQIIEGAGHSMTGKTGSRAMEMIINYLDSQKK